MPVDFTILMLVGSSASQLMYPSRKMVQIDTIDCLVADIPSSIHIIMTLIIDHIIVCIAKKIRCCRLSQQLPLIYSNQPPLNGFVIIHIHWGNCVIDTYGLNNGVVVARHIIFFIFLLLLYCVDRSIHLLSRTSSIDKFANIVVDYVVVLDVSWLVIMYCSYGEWRKLMCVQEVEERGVI